MSLIEHLDVASAGSYAIAFLVPALDAVVPVLPSETAVITLGVATAGSVDVRIGILVALAAAGAWAGDNLCYVLGRRFGPVLDRRLFSGERGVRRREWARHALARRGAALIVACRFIPGGRTAVTVTCGATAYPRRAFVGATAVAGALWASYAFALGRIGGKRFEDRPWAGLLLALGVGAGVTVVIEGARRLLSRSRRRRSGVAPPISESAAPLVGQGQVDAGRVHLRANTRPIDEPNQGGSSGMLLREDDAPPGPAQGSGQAST
ncbi:MAG TPA: DedA family protein [Acidimicrobiales bacterium]|nr:DedA family protein [Acidimicrobiales bacterium]